MSDSEKDRFEADCKDTEYQLVYRSEAHLFAKGVNVTADDVAACIRSARDFAQQNQMSRAQEALLSAICKMHQAVAARGRFWSLIYIHAVPIWAYHISVVAIVMGVGIYFDILLVPTQDMDPSWRIVASMGAYGILGGEVRGLYWLFQKLQGRSFRVQFVIPHLGAPWLAFVLGVLSYLLLKAGVGVFSGAGGSESEYYPYATAAALAGFSWEWFLKQLAKAQGTP